MSEPPAPSGSDYLYALVKGAVSAVPFAGGVAGEVLALAIAPPLAKRRDAWFSDLAARLTALELAALAPPMALLAQDQTFVTVLVNATSVAVRNHREEKIVALRSTVLNTAAKRSPEDDAAAMMLSWVDRFTPLHLAILRQLSTGPNRESPDADWAEEHPMASMLQLLQARNLGLSSHLVTAAWRELINLELVEGFDLNKAITTERILAKHTTVLGDQFLAYITGP